MPIIGRDAKNDHTRSSYARLETIWALCSPVWTRHGFAVGFDAATVPDSNLIRVTLHLSHEAGHTETFVAPDTPPDSAGSGGKTNKTIVQANQSTVTYIQRGLLCRAIALSRRWKTTTATRRGAIRRHGNLSLCRNRWGRWI